MSLGESLNLIVSFLNCKMGGTMAPPGAAMLIEYDIHCNILGILQHRVFIKNLAILGILCPHLISCIQNNADGH